MDTLPYKFLIAHGRYPKGEIAGLDRTVGDLWAATTRKTAAANGDPIKTPVCRRATAADLEAAAKKRGPATKQPLVTVEFLRSGYMGYRGPTRDRKADIAGFPARTAKKLVEGFRSKGRLTKRYARYYVATADGMEPPAVEPVVEKPRPPRARKPRRRRAVVNPETK